MRWLSFIFGFLIGAGSIWTLTLPVPRFVKEFGQPEEPIVRRESFHEGLMFWPLYKIADAHLVGKTSQEVESILAKLDLETSNDLSELTGTGTMTVSDAPNGFNLIFVEDHAAYIDSPTFEHFIKPHAIDGFLNKIVTE